MQLSTNTLDSPLAVLIKIFHRTIDVRLCKPLFFLSATMTMPFCSVRIGAGHAAHTSMSQTV